MKRTLGKTDFQLNPIGLGAMPLSIQNRPSTEAALEVLETAIKNGVDFIDTANAYCVDETDKGHNEQLIQATLKKHPNQKVVVATKGGCTRFDGAWGVDARPEKLRTACEKSLKDLGRDCIDLYYLHAPDSKVEIEDSVVELSRLQQEGKVRHIGVSNFDQDQLKRALAVTRVEAVQNRCNPFLQQAFKSGLVQFCKEQQIAFVAHSPVGGHRGHVSMKDHPVLKKLAQKYETSPYCICLNWLLHKAENIFVIPGASKTSSILNSLKATDFQLSAEDQSAIDSMDN